MGASQYHIGCHLRANVSSALKDVVGVHRIRNYAVLPVVAAAFRQHPEWSAADSRQGDQANPNPRWRGCKGLCRMVGWMVGWFVALVRYILSAIGPGNFSSA